MLRVTGCPSPRDRERHASRDLVIDALLAPGCVVAEGAMAAIIAKINGGFPLAETFPSSPVGHAERHRKLEATSSAPTYTVTFTAPKSARCCRLQRALRQIAHRGLGTPPGMLEGDLSLVQPSMFPPPL